MDQDEMNQRKARFEALEEKEQQRIIFKTRVFEAILSYASVASYSYHISALYEVIALYKYQVETGHIPDPDEFQKTVTAMADAAHNAFLSSLNKYT